MKTIKKILKIILYFVLISFLMIILIMPSHRYRILKLKKDITVQEQRLLTKCPFKSLYYMEMNDSTIYYFEYESGVLAYEGGFYRISINTGRRIRR